MSHFIENTYDLQHEPILKPINRQIVIPNLNPLLTSYSSNRKEPES